MKDYEKAAIGIAVAALGFAAYQAHKTKQAADAVQATDPARNPVTAAIELSKNMVGNTTSWFKQRYDDATGFTKGKASNVVNTIKAVPSGVSYWTTKAVDFGRDAAESGTKYIWNVSSKGAATGKEKIQQLTNKGFTLMGSLVQRLDISRTTPKTSRPVADSLTGVGSKTEITEKTLKERIYGVLPTGFRLSRRSGR